MKSLPQALHPKTWPVWAKWAAGYLGVAAFAAGLVYYWRFMFMLGNAVPAVPLTFGVLGVCTILYGLFFLISRFGKDNLCLKAALCVFAVGLLFCFFTVPMQVPDEQNHFLRAYSISQGKFDYDASRGYPGDVEWLLEMFPSKMNHSVLYAKGELAPQRFLQYRQMVDTGTPAPNTVGEPIMFTVVPYLLQALAIALARLLGFTALGALYAARMANLLPYALVCYFAFKNCDKYREVFFAVALLPLSLFMAASASYDSLILAAGYYAVSFFCKKEINNLDVCAFFLAVLYASCFKPQNLVLAAVILLIPKTRWKSSARPWVVLGGAVAVGVGLYLLVGKVNALRAYNYPEELPRGVQEGVDEAAQANAGSQMAVVLANPVAFLARAVYTVYENNGFLFNLGIFGWMDMLVPMVGGLSVLSLAAAAALGIQQKEDTKYTAAIALGLASLLYDIMVIGAIFVAENHVASIRIVALQPRYFLPSLLMKFMLCSILLGKAVRPRLPKQPTLRKTENYSLGIATGVGLVSAVLLLQNGFIGQWVAQSEGGYKLVNLIGWMANVQM